MTNLKKLTYALLVVSFLAILRLIHLGADTPLDVGTWSRGVYVDEGYKVLSPRNLALFGTTHWNPHDTYPGWMKKSPATQWPYYLAFRAFGPRLASARIVTILYFILLLVGFCYATAEVYDGKLFLAGLLLLGLQETVFFFSRLAMFEVPVMTVVYGLLFVLRKRGRESLGLTVSLVAVFAAAATFGIKVTSLVYLFPVVIGLAIAWLIRLYGDPEKMRKIAPALLALLALFAVLLFMNREVVWLNLLVRSPRAYLSSILLNQMMPSSALLVAAGLFCAFDALLTHPRRFLGDPYRSALLLTVLLGPLMLAAIAKQPLRYYVPLLPAHTLLVLEWLHLFARRGEVSVRAPWPRAGVCFAVLCWSLFSLAEALNWEVLVKLPINIGQSPGLTGKSLFLYVTPLAVAAGAVLWTLRAKLLRRRVVLGMVAGMIGLSALQDVVAAGRFLLAPSYRSAEIARDIEELVGPEASILGDYAPYFATHTRLEALYMNRSFNRPSHLPLLRADFLVFSNTTEMEEMPRLIEATEGVRLLPPIYASTYAERDIVLHPLIYDDRPES